MDVMSLRINLMLGSVETRNAILKLWQNMSVRVKKMWLTLEMGYDVTSILKDGVSLS